MIKFEKSLGEKFLILNVFKVTKFHLNITIQLQDMKYGYYTMLSLIQTAFKNLLTYTPSRLTYLIYTRLYTTSYT